MKQDNPVQNSNSTQFLKVKYKGELDNDCPRSIALHEIVPAMTNHPKLSEALRSDMQLAVNELLSTHYVLSEITKSDKPINGDNLAIVMFRHVEKCLAHLDCIEHINPRDIEADFIENTVDDLLDEVFRVNDEINNADNDELEELLIVQLHDLEDEIDRREADFCYVCFSSGENGVCNCEGDSGKIENTTEALEAEATRLGQAVMNADAHHDSPNFYGLILGQAKDVQAEIDRRESYEENHAQEFLAAMKDISDESARFQHSSMTEYDHTDYQFCDDCGKTNCICDGAIDGWCE